MRSACARVAECARSVRIDRDRLERYAADLPVDEVRSTGADAFRGVSGSTSSRVAFVLTLNAINFGSGYFPHLTKRDGMSGYRTLESCLLERFQLEEQSEPSELRTMTAPRCAELLNQAMSSPEVRELMQLYARSWRDLGTLVEEHFAGNFVALVSDASGSAARLVGTLLEMPLYSDLSSYDGRVVPFLKRAQLCVADLAQALAGDLGRFEDLERLTAFADNLVPHVLRLDGILVYEPGLVARIERGELIASGSPEEIEIRACAVHAVELLVGELQRRSVELASHTLDGWLWLRGGAPAFKAQPRHRTRCTFY